MDPDWQTWAAAAVVIVTAVIFLLRILSKKKGGCGSCGASTGIEVKRR